MTTELPTTKRALASLELLYAIGRELAGQLDLRQLLQRVLDRTLESVGAGSGSLLGVGGGGPAGWRRWARPAAASWCWTRTARSSRARWPTTARSTTTPPSGWRPPSSRGWRAGGARSAPARRAARPPRRR